MMNCKGAAGPKTITAIVILSLFTVFIIQNSGIVEISFFFWKIRLSRVVLLMGSLLVGILVGFFAGWEAAVKKRSKMQY
jgi:putative membrane protein